MNGTLIHGAVLGVAILITMLSMYGVISPKSLANWMSGFMDKAYALPVAVISRIVIGVIFLLAAETTRYPDVFFLICGLSILVALLMPVVGKEKIDKFIRWGSGLPSIVIRLWCVLGVAIGLLLGYGVM
jgi:hypothetical protein